MPGNCKFDLFQFVEMPPKWDKWGKSIHQDQNVISWIGGLDTSAHDDVIKWKHFPCYWPFVRGIHRSPVNSPAQRPVTRSFDVFFDLRLNKRLSKQSWGWWFGTQSHPLWRHCNEVNFKPFLPCILRKITKNPKIWPVSLCQNAIKMKKINRWWPKSDQFWWWSGYISISNFRPFKVTAINT